MRCSAAGTSADWRESRRAGHQKRTGLLYVELDTVAVGRGRCASIRVVSGYQAMTLGRERRAMVAGGERRVGRTRYVNHFSSTFNYFFQSLQSNGHSADHRTAGIPLSGRVNHVCHYLPVQASLNRSHSTDEAPLTPPPEANSPVLENKNDYVRTLVPRYGHAAMISGIRSLAAQRSSSAGPAISKPPHPPRRSPLPPRPFPRPLRRSRSPARASSKGSARSSKKPRGRTSPQSPIRTTIARLFMCRCGWRTRSRMDNTMDIANKPSRPSSTTSSWQDITSEDTSQDTHYAAYAAANQAFAERIKGAHLHPLLPPVCSSSSRTSSASSSPTRTTPWKLVIGLFVRM
ncbi:hypothetical protein B0H16DRAFT_766961 [Mycena metata]|uniref:Uncharacterized protein n=1 Tax=Mycena metata TaxID=1033252 RepID=A0AAD7GQ57_9AGAR|nr:hypothetical protein B0H16DRAFT_766961 [Mycena metata]